MRRSLLSLLLPGALLYLLSNGNVTVPLAAWLAPVLLLRFSRCTAALPGQLLLLTTLLLTTYPMLYGIIPPFLGALAFGLTAYYALLVYVPYGIDRLLAPRLGGFAATLVLPAAATAADYIAGVWLGTWNSVAYTQHDHLPLVQLASLTGMWGITFLIFWTAAVVQWAWDHRFEPMRIARGGLALVLVLGAVHLYGGLRLALADDTPETVVAAAIAQGPGAAYREALEEAGASSIFDLLHTNPQAATHIAGARADDLLALTRDAADRGARIVLWAEAIVAVPEADEATLLAKAAALAKERQIHVALAYFVVPPDFPEVRGKNKTVLVGPSGPRWDYRKARLVPGAREIVGDGTIPVMVTPAGRTATAICYDMDFPDLIRGARGADVMLVPAWDWRAIDPLHANMATYRAVEMGFNMLRATGEGLSIASDAYGRTLGRMDYFAAGDEKLMLVHLPMQRAWTLYALAGDWLAWLCLMAIPALGLLAWKRRQSTFYDAYRP